MLQTFSRVQTQEPSKAYCCEAAQPTATWTDDHCWWWWDVTRVL